MTQIPLLAAIDHHRQGRISEAIAGYRAIVAEDPGCLQAMKLLTGLLSDGPEISAAEDLLNRYRTIAPDDPAVMHMLGRLRRRVDDHASAIVWFTRAIAQWPDHAPLYNDLGETLHRASRLPEALAALETAVALDSAWPLARYNLATVYFDAGMLDQAEAAYRHVLSLAPDFYDAYPMLADTLEALHRPEEAEREGREFARRRGVLVHACRAETADARVLLVGGTGKCNLNPNFIVDQSRFTTIQVHLPPTTGASGNDVPRLPEFDVAFSLIADADRGVPYMSAITGFCAHLTCPVLNPPDHRILRTRRDTLPQVLDGIPDVFVPSTRVIPRAALARSGMAVADGKAFLIRPRGSHNGHDLVRVTTNADLETYLSKVPFNEFYVTDYVDYSWSDRHFRKYRFIFVDREVYPYHLAISDHWLVHYHRTQMATEAWMRAEEEMFLSDYESVFPAELGTAIRTIARAIDLDYAGLDCAISSNGQVLVFESNAAMLAHCNDARDLFPYKHRYVPRIFDAVTRMIHHRMSGHSGH